MHSQCNPAESTLDSNNEAHQLFQYAYTIHLQLLHSRLINDYNQLYQNTFSII